MKFADFLKHAQKSIPDAAAELGVSVEAVRFWVKDRKVPSPDNMTAIFQWSGGLVQPNDFYVLDDGGVRANGHDPDHSNIEAAA